MPSPLGFPICLLYKAYNINIIIYIYLYLYIYILEKTAFPKQLSSTRQTGLAKID